MTGVRAPLWLSAVPYVQPTTTCVPMAAKPDAAMTQAAAAGRSTLNLFGTSWSHRLGRFPA